MARIPQATYDQASPESQRLWDAQLQAHGRMTNMKRTLAHSPVALRALMEWYPLRDAVVPFLGERLTTLFAHAISAGTDCLICSTFFRRILIEAGEDPDQLRLDERERLVLDFGRQLVNDPNRVSDEMFGALSRYFAPTQIIELTVFGGLMIATNVFNNALRVDLDRELEPFRAGVKA